MNMASTTQSSCIYPVTSSQKLYELTAGGRAEIAYIDANTPLTERFGDLGLHVGTRIQCVRVSFLGDPAAYRVEGTDTVLAIRKEDAVHIHVYILDDVAGGTGTWA